MTEIPLSRQEAGAEPVREPVSASTGGLSHVVWPVVVTIAAAAACAPFMHAVFWLGDEGVLLAGAERIVHGERLYADFFEILPPGGFVIVAAWFWTVGISLWSARLLDLLCIAGIACATYLACRQVSRRAVFSAMVALSWVVMTQGFWTEISHHWFTTLASTIAASAAFANLDDARRGWGKPLIAGLAAGAAAMIVPTRGALATLACLAAFAGRGGMRRTAMFVVAAGIVPLVLLVYLAAQQALSAAFDDVIVFSATRYALIQAVPFGYFATAKNFPLKYFYPVLALLTVAFCWRNGRAAWGNPRLRVCVAFGLASFAGIFPRPDIDHIAFSVPLALPLFIYCTTSLFDGWLRNLRSVAVILAVGVVAVPALCFGIVATEALQAPTIETARGRVAFLSSASGTELLAAQIEATPPHDAYFLYPFLPVMSFLTARPQVSKYDLLTPGYSIPAQYREACLSVMRQAAWVVIDRQWTDPAFLKWVFPGMRDTQTEESAMFERALDNGFAAVAPLGQFEVRRRTPAANEALCMSSEVK